MLIFYARLSAVIVKFYLNNDIYKANHEVSNTFNKILTLSFQDHLIMKLTVKRGFLRLLLSKLPTQALCYNFSHNIRVPTVVVI